MYGRGMRSGKMRSTFAVELFSQRAGAICGFVHAATSQFGHDEIDEILMRARQQGMTEIEAIDTRLRFPGFERIGYFCRRADEHRPLAADRVEDRELANGPNALGVG